MSEILQARLDKIRQLAERQLAEPKDKEDDTAVLFAICSIASGDADEEGAADEKPV